jgi:hypothetical protein
MFNSINMNACLNTCVIDRVYFKFEDYLNLTLKTTHVYLDHYLKNLNI